MLSVTAFFTQDGGAPATGLALADVALYLTAIAKANGAATVIWDGTQHPSAEVAGLGLYLRQYSGEDTVLCDYVAGALYTGAAELDTDWTTGVLAAPVKTDASGRVEVSGTKNTLDALLTALQGADGDTLKDLSDEIAAIGSGSGSGTGTYTDTVTDGTNPLDGVRVQLSTDSVKANPVYQAYTNALGVFLFHPDPGAYYVWFEKAGYDFSAVNGTGVTVT